MEHMTRIQKIFFKKTRLAACSDELIVWQESARRLLADVAARAVCDPDSFHHRGLNSDDNNTGYKSVWLQVNQICENSPAGCRW